MKKIERIPITFLLTYFSSLGISESHSPKLLNILRGFQGFPGPCRERVLQRMSSQLADTSQSRSLEEEAEIQRSQEQTPDPTKEPE
jgi:hypothetical protein